MGLEARCSARLGRRSANGRAILDHDRLIFRGEFGVTVPFREMSSVTAADGKLVVTASGGTLALNLGSAADKWAHEIRNPKSRADKLGLKPNAKTAIVGLRDASFLEEVEARCHDLTVGSFRRNCDLIFVGCERPRDLSRLEKCRSHLAPAGAAWVVFPKGVEKITKSDVMKAGKAARLVDVKVASFSETHTALKFVIPKHQR